MNNFSENVDKSFKGLSLLDCLESHAATQSDTIAFEYLQIKKSDNTRISFGQLWQAVNNFSSYFQRLNQKGERALLLLNPGQEYIISFIGCIAAGLIPVPLILPPTSKIDKWQQTINNIANDAGAKWFISGFEFKDICTKLNLPINIKQLFFEEICSSQVLLPFNQDVSTQINQHDIAFLQYTSGSTGDPKGVIVSQQNLSSNTSFISDAFELEQQSTSLSWLPPFHDMGLIGCILTPLYKGITSTLLHPAIFIADPLRWLKEISERKIHISGGPNFAFDMCVARMQRRPRKDLDLSSWQVAFCGAEPINPNTVKSFCTTFAPYGFRAESFHSCYGLAENTLLATKSGRNIGGTGTAIRRYIVSDNFTRVKHTKDESKAVTREFVSSGTVKGDQQIMIAALNDDTSLPDQSVGEVWIHGPSTASGYWNNEKQTQVTFITDKKTNKNWLRTGDLGFLDDGELYITGRAKDLIIFGGKNYYPQDIENSVFNCSEMIKEHSGAAFAINHQGNESFVVVQEIKKKYLRADLTSVIGKITSAIFIEHGITPHVVLIVHPSTVPKTTSGKIRRSEARRLFDSGYYESHTLHQSSEVLSEQIDHIGVDKPFGKLMKLIQQECKATEAFDGTSRLLDLQIDSINMIKLIGVVNDIYQVDMPLDFVYSNPTIAEFSDKIDQLECQLDSPSLVDSLEGTMPVLPLQPSKKSLWMVQQIQSEDSKLHIAYSIELVGKLDIERLKDSIERVAAQIGVFNSNIVAQNGVAVQKFFVLDNSIEFTQQQLFGDCAEQRQQKLQTFVSKGFDLTEGEKSRFLLQKLDSDHYRLIFCTHHLFFDYHSAQIFIERLSRFYQATNPQDFAQLHRQNNIQLNEDIKRLRRVNQAEQHYLASPQYQIDLNYWQCSLIGLNEPLFNKASALNIIQSHTQNHTATLVYQLNQSSSAAIGMQAKGLGITCFSLFYALFQMAVAKITSKSDFVIGVTFNMRKSTEALNLVDYMVNLLPIRFHQASGQLPFEQLSLEAWVLQTNQQIKQGLAHGLVPLLDIVNAVNPTRYGDAYPLLQAMFNFFPKGTDNSLVNAIMSGDYQEKTLFGCRINNVENLVVAPQLPLSLSVIENQKGFTCVYEYDRRYLTENYVNSLVDVFTAIMNAFITNTQVTLPTVAYGDKSTVAQWSAALQNKDLNFHQDKKSFSCITEVFFNQASQTPDAIALTCGEQQWYYRQLAQRVLALALGLQVKGIHKGMLVAVCLGREADLVVSLLAIMHVGGAYVPIDPAYPEQRKRYMLNDARPTLILTEQLLADTQVPCYTPSQLIDNPGKDQAVTSVIIDNNDLAYVLYTSGSTGEPKGVKVSHGNVLNLLSWAKKEFDQSQMAGVLATTSVCFDLSVFELFATLCCGGRVIILDSVLSLRNLPSDSDARLLNSVPSAVSELLKSGDLPASLTTVNLAGEAFSVQLAKALYAQGIKKVYNLYGPSETTTYSTAHLIDSSESPLFSQQKMVPIGHAIDNTALYVLDEHLLQVPPEVKGELYIGGAGVTVGYHQRDDLTKSRYLPDMFNPEDGRVMYRTGDIVSYNCDGVMYYHARKDNQIKLRGIRIELGEIEAQLKQFSEVAEAIVLLQTSQKNPQLSAFIELEPCVVADADEVIALLKQQLPLLLSKAMVPSGYKVMTTWPLTLNGKIDRNALPVLKMTAGRRLYIKAETDTEKRLVTIWADMLNLLTQDISTSAGFFELGGHSLLAVRLVSQIREIFGQEIALKTIFDTQQIKALATLIDQASEQDNQLVSRPPIKAIEHYNDYLPLSYAQQRLWVVDQIQVGSAQYNMPAMLRLKGAVNVALVEQAISRIIQRHEALRTVFVEDQGTVVQKVRQIVDFSLKKYDLSEFSQAEQHTKSIALFNHDSAKIFDLSSDLLIRGSYIVLSDEGALQTSILILNLHHIVSDGWSMNIFIREFVTQYQALLEGKQDPLPPLAIQYADYAEWQRKWLQCNSTNNQLIYWQQQLTDISEVHSLPLDYPRPTVKSHVGDTVSSTFSTNLSQQLRQYANDKKITLYMLLHAALGLVLARHSNNHDIVIGSPMANRLQTEVEPLIGFFVNTLVLRTDSRVQNLDDYLMHVKAVNLAAQANQDIPFEQLVEHCQVTRNTQYTPLFQILFSLNNAELSELALPDVEISIVTDVDKVAKFDLDISAEDGPDGIKFWWVYDTSLFKRERIVQLDDHLQRLLSVMVDTSEQMIKNLPMLSHLEIDHQLEQLNNNATDYPQKLAHQLFEAQVTRTPNHVALMFEGESLDYHTLNQISNRLAHYLRAHGVGNGTLVGLCVGRSIEMITGLLAILKAGGCYLPLDPNYPQARLDYMIKDSGLQYLLTQTDQHSVSELIDCTELVVLDINASEDDHEAYSNNNLPCLSEQKLSSQAYVIYTSGSTGQPKGVMIEHRGMANLGYYQQQKFELSEASRVLHFASLSFDAASWEWLMALSSGAGLYLCNDAQRHSPKQLAEYLVTNAITHATLPPALLHHLPLHQDYSFEALIVAGESCDEQLAKQWAAQYPLFNAYGPTESTVCASVAKVQAEGPLTIGRSIANSQLLVLDENAQLLPQGSIGELYIGGDGLAIGYLNRPELTAKCFIQNPFNNDPAARIYRTGDLARYLPDGNLQFIGRIDAQVKIRGFRIELSEIEQTISACAEVASCVVLVRSDNQGHDTLIAYVVPKIANQPTEKPLFEVLRQQLQQQIPAYMIPSAFVSVTSWPLTSNGKIDRQLLLRTEIPNQKEAGQAPSNPLEQQILDCWNEVLEQPINSVNSLFFSVGGDSLMAIRLASLISESSDRQLDVQEIFIHQTVSAQAKFVSLQTASKKNYVEIKSIKRVAYSQTID